MKNLNSIYLMIWVGSLLSGCGGSRGGSMSASSAVKQNDENSLSALVIRPQNTLGKMREWTSESGQKFILLGTFDAKVFSSFRASQNTEYSEIGTLSFSRVASTYAPLYSSGEPVTTVSHTSQDTEYKVYLIVSGAPNGQVMLGVKPGAVSLALVDESNLVSVGSAFKFQCFNLQVPNLYIQIYGASMLTVPTYTTTCNLQNICDMKRYGEANYSLAYDDAVLSQRAICLNGAMVPTRIFPLPNTSHLETFQIKMTGSFATVAKEVDFDSGQ